MHYYCSIRWQTKPNVSPVRKINLLIIFKYATRWEANFYWMRGKYAWQIGQTLPTWSLLALPAVKSFLIASSITVRFSGFWLASSITVRFPALSLGNLGIQIMHFSFKLCNFGGWWWWWWWWSVKTAMDHELEKRKKKKKRKNKKSIKEYKK